MLTVINNSLINALFNIKTVFINICCVYIFFPPTFLVLNVDMQNNNCALSSYTKTVFARFKNCQSSDVHFKSEKQILNVENRK